VAFEYADIHDNASKRLIPDSSSAYGAICKKCNQDIDNDLLDAMSVLYEKEFDSGIESDMTNLEIKCANCGHANTIGDVKFNLDTAVNNQYIQFIDIESNFNQDQITEIARALNCSFKIIYDRI